MALGGTPLADDGRASSQTANHRRQAITSPPDSDARSEADPDGPLAQATDVGLGALTAAAGAALLSCPALVAAPPAAARAIGIFFVAAAIATLAGARAHFVRARGGRAPRAWAVVFASARIGVLALTVGLSLLFTAWPAAGACAATALVGIVLPEALARAFAARARRGGIVEPAIDAGWRRTVIQLAAAALYAIVLVAIRLATRGGALPALVLVAGVLTAAGALLQVSLKRRRRSVLGLDYNTIFHIFLTGAFLLLFFGLVRG